jgi:hypothetical protein
MEELIKIQSELKAPKNQYNNFGKYKYRSCEDILEAVKPLCAKSGALLTITDEIVPIGENLFVKAVANFIHGEFSHSVTAWAMHPKERKGMDASQVTGATSSYARKYALNGLFLIDDTKDADATNNGDIEKTEEKPKTKVKKKPALPDNKFADAVKFLKNGKTMDELKTYYTIDKEIEKKLNEAML